MRRDLLFEYQLVHSCIQCEDTKSWWIGSRVSMGVEMKILIGVMILLALSGIAAAQENKPVNPEKNEITVSKEVISELPRGPFNLRPKVTLQEALKKAEQFVKKHKIDVSKYYLAGVTSFMYGGEDQKKEVVWQFGWMNERGAIGDYRTILVSQENGAVWQIPSIPSM